MTWKGAHDQLQTLLTQFNKQYPTKTFDCKISKEEIAFLDAKINIDHNRNI